MHETIKIDSDANNALVYTNLKTKKYDIPIIFKNGNVLNSFDQFTVTNNGWNMEVIFDKNVKLIDFKKNN